MIVPAAPLKKRGRFFLAAVPCGAPHFGRKNRAEKEKRSGYRDFPVSASCSVCTLPAVGCVLYDFFSRISSRTVRISVRIFSCTERLKGLNRSL